MKRSKRKTISVEELKDLVNSKNTSSLCNPKQRDGWNVMLEEVLHATDNYNGFNYLRKEQMECDQDPGIITFHFPKPYNHLFLDESRRYYY